MSKDNKGRRYAYISGPITGRDQYQTAFWLAERYLKACGYEVVNPAKLSDYLPRTATWDDFMKLAFASEELCDTIYMLAGWQTSRGATLELKHAKDLGMNIIYEEAEVEGDSEL